MTDGSSEAKKQTETLLNDLDDAENVPTFLRDPQSFAKKHKLKFTNEQVDEIRKLKPSNTDELKRHILERAVPGPVSW